MSQVTSPTDVALVTRLQRRVKELEQEKTRLRRDLEENEHDAGAGGDPEREMYDAIKVRGHPIGGVRGGGGTVWYRSMVAE